MSLSEQISERVKQLRQGSQPNACPGETNCSYFQGAAGANREEKEKEACTNCEKFPTKYKAVEETAALANVERFVQERRAGFSPDPNRLTSVEYEGVLLWTDLEFQYDLIYQQSLVQIGSTLTAMAMMGKK